MDAAATKEFTTAELNAAAKKECGDGAIGTTEAACRNGFRNGYTNNKTLQDACIDRETPAGDPVYTDEDRSSCKKGYAAGADLKPITFSNGTSADPDAVGKKCGKDNPDTEAVEGVKTKFNFGCLGDKYDGDRLSPIEDMLYAFVRFISVGVGIAVVISMILAGIQYSSSEGNPEATQAAKGRIRISIGALLIYLFTFSLVQYLVPGGVFNSAVPTPPPISIEVLERTLR